MVIRHATATCRDGQARWSEKSSPSHATICAMIRGLPRARLGARTPSAPHVCHKPCAQARSVLRRRLLPTFRMGHGRAERTTDGGEMHMPAADNTRDESPRAASAASAEVSRADRAPSTEEEILAAYVTPPKTLSGPVLLVDYDHDLPQLF